MDILEQYQNVFRDMVECYIEGMYEEDIPNISKEDIDCIVDRLIRKSDYMWEIINETIQANIDRIVEMEE